jgi:hypothetical protein
LHKIFSESRIQTECGIVALRPGCVSKYQRPYCLPALQADGNNTSWSPIPPPWRKRMTIRLDSLEESLFREVIRDYVSWEKILAEMGIIYTRRSTGVLVSKSLWSGERTPSCFFRPSLRRVGTGNFTCYSSGCSGDKFDFVCRMFGIVEAPATRRTIDDLQRLARFFDPLLGSNVPPFMRF